MSTVFILIILSLLGTLTWHFRSPDENGCVRAITKHGVVGIAVVLIVFWMSWIPGPPQAFAYAIVLGYFGPEIFDVVTMRLLHDLAMRDMKKKVEDARRQKDRVMEEKLKHDLQEHPNKKERKGS